MGEWKIYAATILAGIWESRISMRGEKHVFKLVMIERDKMCIEQSMICTQTGDKLCK